MKKLKPPNIIALIIGCFSFLIGAIFLLQGATRESGIYTMWLGFTLAGSAIYLQKDTENIECISYNEWNDSYAIPLLV